MATAAELAILLTAEDRASGKLRGIGGQAESMGRIIGQASKIASAAMIGLGTASFKTAMDFEASMSQIVGLVGVSREQVASWKEDLLKLGPQVAKSPQELAEALYFVTSAGFQGQQALDVLTTSARAAAAGLGETKIVADALTSAINAYGIENLNATAAADILTAAVREGKLEATELAPVMGRLLPISAALGIGFEQVAGVLAVMSRTGLDAAEASTSLSAIMSTLLKPGEAAAEVLEDVGLSMGDLRDMAAKPGGLLEVLKTLDEAFGDNDEALATVIPNIRALRGVMNVLAQNAGTVENVLTGVAEATGSLDNAFEAAQETAKFRLNAALSELQGLLVTLGSELLPILVPILRDVTTGIEDVTEAFSDLSPETQENIVKFGLFVAAAGPVIGIIGRLVGALRALGAGFVATKALVAGAGIAGPIGAAVAAAGAAVVAWNTLWEGQVADWEERSANWEDDVDRFNQRMAAKQLPSPQFPIFDITEYIKTYKQARIEAEQAIGEDIALPEIQPPPGTRARAVIGLGAGAAAAEVTDALEAMLPVMEQLQQANAFKVWREEMKQFLAEGSLDFVISQFEAIGKTADETAFEILGMMEELADDEKRLAAQAVQEAERIVQGTAAAITAALGRGGTLAEGMAAFAEAEWISGMAEQIKTALAAGLTLDPELIAAYQNAITNTLDIQREKAKDAADDAKAATQDQVDYQIDQSRKWVQQQKDDADYIYQQQQEGIRRAIDLENQKARELMAIADVARRQGERQARAERLEEMGKEIGFQELLLRQLSPGGAPLSAEAIELREIIRLMRLQLEATERGQTVDGQVLSGVASRRMGTNAVTWARTGG